MLGVGVIGHGYWGPNLVRNFMTAPGSAVTAVCDTREERLTQLRKVYPGLKIYNDAAAGPIGDQVERGIDIGSNILDQVGDAITDGFNEGREDGTNP